MSEPAWQVAPGAVTVAGDNNGSIRTGPTYVRVAAGRFDRVHDAIFDPAPLAEQLDLARFEGRKDLIARIDQRIARQDRGYVLVRGEAGVGKSALAAHLVWTRPCAHHFTRLEGGARNPVEARKSLAAHLIGAWDLAERFTPGDVFPAAAERPDWLAKVIRAAAAERDRQGERRPLVLVVDGLDEAEPDAPGMGTGVPLGLPKPDELPRDVFIVATSRYGFPLAVLRDPMRVGWSEIEVESADNLADMAAYLESAATELSEVLARHGVSPHVFTSTLLDRCRGVWIYLRYVLDEIRAGIRPPTELAALPDRLRAYYELQIQHRWATSPGWERLHLPALAVLAVLRRPITAAELSAVLGEPGRVADWLDGPARAFLDVTSEGEPARAGGDEQARAGGGEPARAGGGERARARGDGRALASRDEQAGARADGQAPASGNERAYQIRHQSLRDLFSASLDEGEPVDAGLADRLRAAARAAHQRVTTWLIPQDDDYTRLELPGHAAEAGVLDSLMTDPGFMLNCSSGQILRFRHVLTSRSGIAAAAALGWVATSEWNSSPDDLRAWWLQVWARRARCGELADAIIGGHPEWPWHIGSVVWSGTGHRTMTGHRSPITAVAVVPETNGRRRVVSADDDGLMLVWDVDSGEECGELPGHLGSIRALAVVPGADGSHRVVSSADDRMALLWDIETGELVAELTGEIGWFEVMTAAPVADGRWQVVSAGGDGVVRLWDPATGDLIDELIGHNYIVAALAAARDAEGVCHIVSADDDGVVKIWDAEVSELVSEVFVHRLGVAAVAILQEVEGPYQVVIHDSTGSMWVWDPESDELIKTPVDGVHRPTVLPGTGGRHRIVSGDPDGIVRIVDLATGDLVGELIGHEGSVSALAAARFENGQYGLVSAGDDGTVRLWDDRVDEMESDLIGHTGQINATAVVPGVGGAPRIVSASGDGMVRFWDPDTGSSMGELNGRHGRVYAFAGLPGRLVTAGADGDLRFWDVGTGDLVRELPGNGAQVNALTVLGRRVVAGGGDGQVRAYDAGTGELIWQASGSSASVNAVAASTDRVMSAGGDRWLRVWDAATGDLVGALEDDEGWTYALAAFRGADGRDLLASGGSAKTVKIWDLATGERIEQLTGHTGWIHALEVMPGRIVSASSDETVRLWDTATFEPAGELIGHTGPVNAIALLPGNRIVSAGDDRAIMVWRPSQG